MSRIASRPVVIPEKVGLTVNGQRLTVKGPKGELSLDVTAPVTFRQEENIVHFEAPDNAQALAGTMNALLANNVHGVSEGYQRHLSLVGVGYRAEMKGKVLNLNLGFSHPVRYTPPPGIAIETPSQDEVVISGADKQKVGQAAAEIRAWRPPEPYKGKGVRYRDERVLRKEAKKK